MASDGQTTYPRPPGARTGPGAWLARDGARDSTYNTHRPCKRCGGLGDAHYLTCPLLRLSDQPEPLR
jgi:hypothetical protein